MEKTDAHRSAAALVLVLVVAVSSPAWGRDEWASERERAAATARTIELEWPLAGPGPVSDYLRELGARLGTAADTPHARWRFTVVRDHAPNAFAIGDGRIYVTEGVIAACDDEAEVAAILAHEMGHELAGHLRPRREPDRLFGGWLGGDEPVQSVGSVLQPLEPEKELEADRWSISILQRAGYDPWAALSIAERLAGHTDRGSEHFGEARRIARLRDALAGVRQAGALDSRAFRELKASTR